MKIKYVFLLLIVAIGNSYSQVGIGTTNPDASSSLDISSPNTGLLIPRINLTDVSDGTAPINSPAISLLVYNTNASIVGGNGEGYYYWNGTQWTKLQTNTDDKWTRSNAFGTLYPTTLTDRVGIGTNNPFTNLHVKSSSSNPVIFDGGNNLYVTLAENGINRGYIGSYAGNPEDVEFGTYAGNSGALHLTTNNTPKLTVINNGNVGIGTTNPSAKTEISGSGITELKLSSTAGFGATRFSMISDRGLANEWRPAYIEDGDNGGFTGRLDFYTNGTGAGNLFGSVRAMSIVNGKIGIGTTLPNAPLQFSNAIQNRKIVLYDSNNNDNQYYGFGINGAMLRYQTDATIADHVFFAGVNATISNELMRIKGNGNVGIGTSNPLQRFDVQGGNARINNAFIGDVGHGATWAGFSNYNQANTTGYGFLLSSDGNYTLINKQNTGAGYIGFRIANTDQAVITNAGNMGIGTTTPSQKLDVIGKIKITDGTQGTGKILTSDGAGTSSWSNLGSVMQSWQTSNNCDFIGCYTENIGTGFTEIPGITTVVNLSVKSRLMISAVVNMRAFQLASLIGGWGEIRLELDGNPLNGTTIQLYNLNGADSNGTYANYMVDLNPGSYTFRVTGRSTGEGITVDFNGKYMSILGMPIN